MMRLTPLTVRLVAAAAGLPAAPRAAVAQATTLLFAASAPSEPDAAGACAVSVGPARYVVTRDGVVRGPLGGRARSARLPNPGGAEVDRVWGAPHAGDLLLAVQWTDGESFWTEVARLDPATLARRWRLRLPGFNLGPALVRADTAYLTVIGAVTRVDLRTGRVRWQRGGLYEPTGRADGFGPPRLRGDTLVVPAEPSAPGVAGATARLHARTGRVLGVAGAAPRAGRGSPPGARARHGPIPRTR